VGHDRHGLGPDWGATGNERALAGMDGQAQVSRHFKIRYFSALTEQHRIVYAGQSYNVRFINHVPQDGWTFFDGQALVGLEAN
jgi:head-tail adaptor